MLHMTKTGSYKTKEHSRSQHIGYLTGGHNSAKAISRRIQGTIPEQRLWYPSRRDGRFYERRTPLRVTRRDHGKTARRVYRAQQEGSGRRRDEIWIDKSLPWL